MQHLGAVLAGSDESFRRGRRSATAAGAGGRCRSRSGPASCRIESPPNRSSTASASTKQTTASPTTAAAGTAHTSLRSIAAGASSSVVRSTERSGFISVEIGFMKRGDANLFAVGDAALESAGAIGRSRDRRVGGSPAVDARRSRRARASPGRRAASMPSPMPTPLIAGIDITRLREPSIELSIPLHVRSQSRRHAVRDDFEAAAERVAGLARAIDRGHHRRLEVQCRRSTAANRGSAPRDLEADRAIGGEDDVADAGDVAGDFDAERAQQSAGRSRPRRRVRRFRGRWHARARRADPRARTSTRPRDPRARVAAARPAARFAPVASSGASTSTCMVSCQFFQSLFGIVNAIGRARGSAASHSGEKLGAIRLDAPCAVRVRSRPGGDADPA